MSINGVWYNQLGSVMTLSTQLDGGVFGLYNSAVGNARYNYTLTGRFDARPPPGYGVSLGWVVTYRNDFLNAHSTATWSGQYFNNGASESILTHWLLTTSTLPGPKHDWNSTNLGTDTFTRAVPHPAEIAKAQALTMASPHLEDILAEMNLRYGAQDVLD
jgi:hypothetical protein